MNNQDFLTTLKEAFEAFLSTGSRSNQKLKILHGKIANDLLTLLDGNYYVKALGVEDGREAKLSGRYFDKNVDITIFRRGDDENIAVAAIGVKMIMQNYAQNSNNYFENMMGETANIRSNNIPYFQVFAIPDKLPYYNDDKEITKWEGFSQHHAEKYVMMSKDNAEIFMHTPTKTLLFAYHIPDAPQSPTTKQEYVDYYSTHLNALNFTTSSVKFGNFGNAVVFNDYEEFIRKVAHYILSI